MEDKLELSVGSETCILEYSTKERALLPEDGFMVFSAIEIEAKQAIIDDLVSFVTRLYGDGLGMYPNPRLFAKSLEKRDGVLLVSNKDKEINGVLVGREIENKLHIDWVISGEKGIGAELVRRMQKKYSCITLIAASRLSGDTADHSALQKLVDYYKELGFYIDTESETYHRSEMEISQFRPMKWTKPI